MKYYSPAKDINERQPMYHFEIKAGYSVIGKIRAMIAVWTILDLLSEKEPKGIFITKDRPLNDKYKITLCKVTVN